VGFFVVLSDSDASFIRNESSVKIFKGTLNNDILVVLAFSGGNISVALFKFNVVLGTLNIFEVDSLEIGSTVILSSVIFARLVVLFIIDQDSVGEFKHSADSSCGVIVHSISTSGSPKSIVSEFKSTE
jgi:hypothetical protein